MEATNPLFKCGLLTVRSSKASKYIKLYEQSEHLSGTEIEYAISGVIPESGPCYFKHQEICGSRFIKNEDNDSYTFSCLDQPIFFDQTHYMVTIDLPDAEEAYLFSPVVSLCESAIWDPDIKRLTIPVNFGNDLGDFELCWEWVNSENERFEGAFRGQVLSTKLDIYSHFRWMIKDIEQYNWIQLDLLRKTTWGWSYDEDADKTLNSWLLIFQNVRSEMGNRFHKLLEQHRRKLISESRMLRPEQMKKISSRLEERIVEGARNSSNQRYAVNKKVLDADTVENRYMKHILFQTLAQLNDVIDKIENIERISDIFKDRLQEWAEEWGILKQHRFWRGIGAFKGLRRESLVLSQDPIYSGIRQSWLMLQQGLSFFEQDLQGGIQNAAQLYEIWCLVQIMKLLEKQNLVCLNENGLHFDKHDEEICDDEERRSGAIKFIYSFPQHSELNKDLTVELLYQPTAKGTPNSDEMWNGMMSVPVVQKPDIVLRLMQADLAIHTWVFDAKYRIDSKKNSAPDDALNQMHRYRDAILWSSPSKEHHGSDLYRESIGAYVLYPGNEIKVQSNHHQLKSIELANIGAFPLKPYDPEEAHDSKPHREISAMFSSIFASQFESKGDGVESVKGEYTLDSIYTNSPKIKD